jgi:hypothetical protein
VNANEALKNRLAFRQCCQAGQNRKPIFTENEVMTNQENQTEAINSTNQLEDLDLQDAAASNIQGGPAFMKLGDIKGEATDEPTQMREHILLAR